MLMLLVESENSSSSPFTLITHLPPFLFPKASNGDVCYAYKTPAVVFIKVTECVMAIKVCSKQMVSMKSSWGLGVGAQVCPFSTLEKTLA